MVGTRGLVTKRVQAVEFGHRPGWFDAIQPSTNLGIIEESRSNHERAYAGRYSGPYRIGSVPHRFRNRPPSAIAITTRISSGRGASATETVIVSKCGKDQESSLCPSGTSSNAPAAATLTFDPINAFPPPIAARIGLPSIGWTQAPPCSISPATPTIAPLPYEAAGPSSNFTNSGISRSPSIAPASNKGLRSSTNFPANGLRM